MGLFRRKNKEKHEPQPLESSPLEGCPRIPLDADGVAEKTESVTESKVTGGAAEKKEPVEPIAERAEEKEEIKNKKEETQEKVKKQGFFGRIRGGLKKTREALAYKINKLFTGGVLDDDFYDELEAALISSDMGAETTERILDDLKEEIDTQHIRDTAKVKAALQKIICDIMNENEPEELTYPAVIMIVGVNGVGKTTTIGKLAAYYRAHKKTVMIAAGDTFRAAAADQLSVWADRADVRVVRHGDGGDPAAVVFDAIKSAQSKNIDVLIVDTAGRLHNKANLMEELKKISRVVKREHPSADCRNYIVLDATTGQNAIAQVETFDGAVDIDGIIITKLDGTAKGGVLVALADQFAMPIYFVGVGEGIDDLMPFDANEFAHGILE